MSTKPFTSEESSDHNYQDINIVFGTEHTSFLLPLTKKTFKKEKAPPDDGFMFEFKPQSSFQTRLANVIPQELID